MTQDEMRAALGAGPEWRLIWAGADPLPTVEHWCGGLYEPWGRYVSETRMLAYTPSRTPGVEVAACRRSRIAWVRRAELEGSPPIGLTARQPEA